MSLRDQLLTADTVSEIAAVLDDYIGANPVNFAKDSSGNVTGLVGAGGGIAGFLACEWLGAAPTATAAENVAAIQAALNLGGVGSITYPGVYQVNTHLRIPSNTEFHI